MVKKISIEYCVEWNYYPEAASLAKAIKKEVGLDVELIKSGGGAFEVMADKKLIFSKKKEQRFPENQEVLESLKNL
jgi:selT/selW/selH-like putative selenoprotein